MGKDHSPVPWSVDEFGELRDANGRLVANGPTGNWGLICEAVNHWAGVKASIDARIKSVASALCPEDQAAGLQMLRRHLSTPQEPKP
ncbi:MAG: hypothetical protein AB7F35_29755 [Acetobacteraceae bacterium]